MERSPVAVNAQGRGDLCAQFSDLCSLQVRPPAAGQSWTPIFACADGVFAD